MRTFPTDLQYQQAIQHPVRCFLDPQLKSSTVAVNGIGLPVPWSGNFAYTYKLTDQDNKIWAIRCFRKDVANRQKRYIGVSNYLNSHASRFLCRIGYLENEMLVEGIRYPITKMPWIDGDTLGDFLDESYYARSTLSALSIEFRDLINYLQKHNIAHGDLSHDNILIHNNGMVLVDYDGLYVPGLEGMASAELGNANFQHPQRKYSDFGSQLDRFSSIVIYLALQALIEKPELWTKYSPTATGSFQAEGILFQKTDFQYPLKSMLLKELETVTALRNAINAFRNICAGPLAEVPTLHEFIGGKSFTAGDLFGIRQSVQPTLYSRGSLEAVTTPSPPPLPVKESLYTLTPSHTSAVAKPIQNKSQRQPNWFMIIAALTLLTTVSVVFGWSTLNSYFAQIILTPTIVSIAQEGLVPPLFPNLPNPNKNGRSVVVTEISTNIVKLNVRSGPGTHYPPVTQVAGGTRFVVHGKSGAWLKVQSADGTISGWVAEQYAPLSSDLPENMQHVDPDQVETPVSTLAMSAQTETPSPNTRVVTTLAKVLPATPTVMLTQSPIQIPATTDTSVPTPTPTSTPQPTATPSSIPAILQANCRSDPDAIFVDLWQQHRTLIGCPSSGKATIPTLAEELFQGGHMFWRSDLDQVYVIYDRTKSGTNLFEGSWQTDPSWKWDNSNPDGIGLNSPSGLYEPKRGFGWLWRTHLGQAEGPLGWALDREYGFNNVGQVQSFEMGFMFKGSDPKIYLLLKDGRFWAR